MQVGIGKHLFPADIADRHRIGGFGRAVESVGFHFGKLSYTRLDKVKLSSSVKIAPFPPFV